MGKVFFVDFDGTITKQDTCEAMVEAFAQDGWQELNELWEKKKISTEECAKRTFQLFQATIDDLKGLLDTIEIDENFPAFVQYCRSKGYPIYVLSDGYDFNIEYVFQKHGLDLTYYANHLEYADGFDITCTYQSPDCDLCGTCKHVLLKQWTNPGSQVVYVGDGLSDTCPASHCDLVFAKGKLLKYCRDNGIKSTAYTSFADILERLQKE